MATPHDPDDNHKFVLLQHATTPDHANLLRALLQGAGIPAHVDGTMLADEFAISQRMMNQQGVKLMVPHDRLAEARDVIASAAVSEDELERQAMAAGGEEESAPATPETNGGHGRLTLLLGILSVIFGSLWMQARAHAAVSHPLLHLDRVGDAGVWTDTWRHNGMPAQRRFDRDGDGHCEEIESFNRDGQLTTTAFDRDADGMWENLIEHRIGGEKIQWTDDDRDGRFDRGEVRGPDRQVITQVLRYVPGQGVAIEPR
jgi:hypothetical protein